jgi:hypothetical protein
MSCSYLTGTTAADQGGSTTPEPHPRQQQNTSLLAHAAITSVLEEESLESFEVSE